MHYFYGTPWLAIHWIKLSGLYMTVASFFSTGLLRTGRIAENYRTTNIYLWGRWEVLLYTVRVENLKPHTVLTFVSKIMVISLHILRKSCLSGLHVYSNIMLWNHGMLCSTPNTIMKDYILTLSTLNVSVTSFSTFRLLSKLRTYKKNSLVNHVNILKCLIQGTRTMLKLSG